MGKSGKSGRPKKAVPPPLPSRPKSPSPPLVSQILLEADLSLSRGCDSAEIARGNYDGDTTLQSEVICDVADKKSENLPTASRKLWVDVLNDNRNSSKGRPMNFIAPKIVNGKVEVLIEKYDIRAEIKFWEPSLVLYALGGELSMNGVKNFMSRTWNFVQLPDIYYNEEGYFILRFNSFR